jgi:TIR domain
MTDPQGTIDFFISYRGAQADWARWVNWVVRSTGYSTVLMDEFQGGTTWTSNMRNAAQTCRRLIPLYSDEYWASGACVEEFDAYWRHHLQGGTARFLLPLEIKACVVPNMHAMLLAVRVHTLSRDAAYAAIIKLLSGIAPCAPVAAFTDSEPPFPNATAAGPGATPTPVAWPPRCPTFVPDMANRHDELAFFADTLCGTAGQRATLISADTDHGKTRLVSEFHRYGCEALGAGACCFVDFKARGTVENLLDTIASDLGPRIPGLANRNPANLRKSLRETRQPVLFVFDTFERATDDAREFVESHFLAELGKADSMRILLAGQPHKVPDPAKAAWRAHARRFHLGSIEDPQPWVQWAARVYPQIPAASVVTVVLSNHGAPGPIASQLATLGTFTAAQLAGLGVK